MVDLKPQRKLWLILESSGRKFWHASFEKIPDPICICGSGAVRASTVHLSWTLKLMLDSLPVDSL